MADRKALGVYVGIGLISLVLGLVLGWKLHGAKLSIVKRRREYHSQKAKELQSRLNN